MPEENLLYPQRVARDDATPYYNYLRRIRGNKASRADAVRFKKAVEGRGLDLNYLERTAFSEGYQVPSQELFDIMREAGIEYKSPYGGSLTKTATGFTQRVPVGGETPRGLNLDDPSSISGVAGALTEVGRPGTVPGFEGVGARMIVETQPAEEAIPVPDPVVKEVGGGGGTGAAPELVPEELQQPAVPQTAAQEEAGKDSQFYRGRGIYEMSMGLGQMQSGVNSSDEREMFGGFMSFLGGMADITVPKGMEDTPWGKIGPVFATIGTFLNLQGQVGDAKNQRDYQVRLQESIGEALLFMDSV